MIDGARLAVALASDKSNGTTLADIASIADVFWIGGTKAGALFGEAIVIPNERLRSDYESHLKQRGALLAKGRVLGVQFRSLFGDGLFEQAAAISNDLAQTLASGVASAGFALAAETESNQVFAVLPNALIGRLSEHFSFYTWEPRPNDESVVRLVTSWATDASQVERFVSMLAD